MVEAGQQQSQGQQGPQGQQGDGGSQGGQQGQSQSQGQQPQGGQQQQPQQSQSQQGQQQQSQSQQDSSNPYINPDGTFKKSFFEHLPEDLQNDKTLQQYKDIQSLAKSHANAEKMLGKKGITIPDEGSSDEEWQRYREAMGVPDSAEKYELPEVELPEGVEGGQQYEQFTQNFKQIAHELNLSNQQTAGLFKAYHDWMDREVQQQREQAEKQRAQVADELRQEWGREYEHNLAASKHAFSQLGVMEQIQQLGLLDDPTMIRLGKQVYDAIGEDTLGAPGGPTYQDIQSEIQQIRNNPNDPFNDPKHPQHREREQYVRNLYKKAY